MGYHNNHNKNHAINGVLHIVDEVILPRSCLYGLCTKEQVQCINQLRFTFDPGPCDAATTQDTDYNRINYCQDEAPLPNDPFEYPVQYSVFACMDTTRKLRLTGGNTAREITEWNEDLTLELEHSHCLPDCVLVSISRADTLLQEFNIDTRCDGDQLAEGDQYGFFTYNRYQCPQ